MVDSITICVALLRDGMRCCRSLGSALLRNQQRKEGSKLPVKVSICHGALQPHGLIGMCYRVSLDVADLIPSIAQAQVLVLYG
jgi:hypothetical protein